jgi:Flp pilus assembly protein TadB
MRTVSVTLGGAEHTLRQLPTRKAADWRKRLEREFQGIADVIERAMTAGETDITDAEALARLVRSIAGPLIGSMDLIVELVEAYDPQLSDALDEAYDDEVIDVFWEVVQMAYPFGKLISSWQGLQGLNG